MTRDSSRRLLWGGVVLAAAIVIAVLALTWRTGTPPSPAPTAAQKIEPPAPPKPVAASPQPAPTAAPPAAAPAGKAATASAPPRQAEVPRFDIVRVDPSGHAVLAGRAAPGSEVTVFDGSRIVGQTKADKDGNWVLVPDQPLPPGQSQLTLSAKAADGTVTRADGVVAMLVPERGPKPASQAAPAPAATATATTAAATEPAKAETPIAVLVPKEGPTKALQLPPLKGKPEERLSMDMVQYGTQGDVILDGRAAPGAKIDAYLGNLKVGTANADGDGKWRIVTTENVPPGRYKLKLESHDGSGKQVAELAMPFERAAVPIALPSDLVIVQPGNSLWRIARRSYGHGRRYVEIYRANRNQIHNPQLIYPGQLLQIPGKS